MNPKEIEIKQVSKEYIAVPDTIEESKVQEALFFSWFKTHVLVFKRRSYRVPAKITQLPCGCKRQRPNEVDVNNRWEITRKSSIYKHKDCGTQINLPQ